MLCLTKESRVSFAKDKDEQWLLVDLEETKIIDEINIRYESAVDKYEIQVSEDGEEFTTVYTKDETTANNGPEFEPLLPSPTAVFVWSGAIVVTISNSTSTKYVSLGPISLFADKTTANNGPEVDEVVKFDAVEARYVKYVQKQRWHHSGNGKWYSGSIYETAISAVNLPSLTSNPDTETGLFNA